MTTTITDLLVRLRDEDDLDGCSDAIDYLVAYDGTLGQAWEDCPRGDWLLWLALRVGVPDAAYTAASEVFARMAYAATYEAEAEVEAEEEILGATESETLRAFLRASAIAVRRHITAEMVVDALDAHADTVAAFDAVVGSVVAGCKRSTT